jgi:hypothetical protein
MLLVNEARNENHWLGLQLVGTTSNKSAIGARVTLTGELGHKPHVWVNEVRSGSSYSSSSDLRLHFGLGSEPRLNRLLIRWPNGESETFPLPALDRIVTLTEGSGKAVSNPAK